METDYLIVGQGIAGSLLAYYLLKAGKKVIVIDNRHEGSASVVAAGIINPVTGRRFVKSWRIDDFLPFAGKAYHEIGETAGISFFKQRNIIWALNDNQQQNDWYARRTDPGYEAYIKSNPETGSITQFCHDPYYWAELEGAATVDLPAVTLYFRSVFENNKALLYESFDFDSLGIKNGGIEYKQVKVRKIIFCEGQKSIENPFFKDLPHQPAKGEVLIVRIPGCDTDKLIKSGIFLVPLGDQVFWAGSGYIWSFADGEPTAKGKADLITSLKSLLKVPFEILEHKAAIRPVFKDRRPVIGLHSDHPEVGIFNGMGTKGASLAPFWASHFADYLTGKISELDKEVSLKRFRQNK